MTPNGRGGSFEPAAGRAGYDVDAGPEELHERPLKGVLQEALAEGKRFIRAEVQLVRAELKQEAKQAGRGAGMLAAGGVLGLLAAMVLTACLVAALAQVMPVWASALIVGLLLAGGAAFLALGGLKALKSIKPKAIQREAKEDAQWASKTLQAAKQQTHAHA